MPSQPSFSIDDLSFEVSLPSAILLNKSVDHMALRLFAFVKGLTKVHGYCYASNAYLAFLLGSSVDTVKRGLVCLKKEGFLRIEVDKAGMHWQRRLFLGEGLKKSLRRCIHAPPPVHPCTPPSANLPPIYKAIDNTKLVVEREASAPPPAPAQKLEMAAQIERDLHVKTTEEEHQRLCKEFGAHMVPRFYKRLSEWKQNERKSKWKLNDNLTIRKWVVNAVREDDLKNPQASSSSDAEINKKLFESVKDGPYHARTMQLAATDRGIAHRVKNWRLSWDTPCEEFKVKLKDICGM